jgi:hypothetical protein
LGAEAVVLVAQLLVQVPTVLFVVAPLAHEREDRRHGLDYCDLRLLGAVLALTLQCLEDFQQACVEIGFDAVDIVAPVLAQELGGFENMRRDVVCMVLTFWLPYPGVDVVGQAGIRGGSAESKGAEFGLAKLSDDLVESLGGAIAQLGLVDPRALRGVVHDGDLP